MKKGLLRMMVVTMLGSSCAAAPGDLKWSFRALPTPSQGFSTSPTLAPDGTILVVAPGEALYGVDASGRELWRFAPAWGVSGSAVVGPGNEIYIGGAQLRALRGHGFVRWSFPSPSGAGFDVPVLGADGTVYCADGDGRLYAVDANGALRWVTPPGRRFLGSPVIDRDGSLYLNLPFGAFGAMNPDGNLRWVVNTPQDLGGPAALADDGTVYVAASGPTLDQGWLYAISPAGNITWTFDGRSAATTSPVIGADGTVYYAFGLGRVVALRPDGALRWEYQAGAPQPDAIVAAPAVAADAMLYVPTLQDQRLHAIAPDGRLAWSFAAGTPLACAPVIGPDGTVYFGGSDGRLFAVEGNGNGPPASQWPHYRRDVQHRSGAPQLPSAPPGVPESVAASIDEFTEKTVVRWSSLRAAAEYSVWRGTAANALAVLATRVAATLQYEDTTATPGVDYFYAVQAINAFEQGPVSPAVPGRRRLAQPGEVVWKLEAGSNITTPALGPDGQVLFGTGNGKVHAVDAMGAKRWVYDCEGTLSYGPVVASDGTVYFTAASRLNTNVAPPRASSLFALGGSGGSKWRYDFSGAAAGGMALARDGTIHVLVQEDEATMALLAFTPQGQLRWRLKQADQTSEPPAIGPDGSIYFATRWGHLYAVSPGGALLWKAQNAVWMNTIAIDGNGLLHVSGGDLVSFNPDGTERWKRPGTDSGVSPACIGLDNTIYVGFNNGRLHALSGDGTQKWEVVLGGMPGASTVGADGTVYAASLMNPFAPEFALHAVSAAGTRLWSFTLGANIGAPVLGSDPTVYFAAADGFLYALRTTAGAASSAWPGFQHDAQHAGRTDMLPPPPGTPPGVQASDRESPSIIQVNWPSKLRASAYDVLRSTNSDPASAVVVATVAAPGWRDLNATPETAYFYWVRARNAGGTSGLAGPEPGMRRQPVPGDVMFEWELDGIVHASPAIAPDGTIYVGVQSRTDTVAPCALYALNPDGTIRWSYAGTTWIFGSPAIGPEGTIYYGAYHQNFVALNPDGSRKWEFIPPSAVIATPSIGSDGSVYFGSLGGGFYAFDSNGAKRWEYTATGSVISSACLAGDGSVFFVAGDHLHALDRVGVLRWRTRIGGSGVSSPVYSSPAMGSDGTIYLGSTFSGFQAIRTDGTPRWTWGPGGTFLGSAAVNAAGNILAGAGGLMSFSADGSTSWSAPIGSVLASPALDAGGRAYVGTREGKFVALESTGEVAWQVDLGAGITSSAAIGADGTIYVGADDRKVRALHGAARLSDGPWPMFQHDPQHTGRSSYRPSLPGAVGPVAASHGDYHDRVELTWPSLPDAYLYEVWRHTNLVFTNAQRLATVGAQTSFSDLTARPGVEYHYWVCALNSQGAGPFSQPATGLRRFPVAGDVLWRSPVLGDGLTAPAAGRDGAIYYAGRDRRLYAVSADFAPLWTYPPTGNGLGISGSISDPALADDGAVLFGAPDSYFYCLNPDGTLRWRWRGFSATWSAPGVGDDTAYVVDGMNNLHAFILADGNRRWNATPYVVGSSAIVEVDGTAIAANANRYLAAFGPGAAQRWLLATTLSAAPLPLLFGPDATVYLANTRRLVAAAPEGTNRWVSNYTGTFITGLVMDRNGTLYGGVQGRLLYALAPNGRKLWEFAAGGEVFAPAALGDNGNIFFAAGDRRLYALNPDGTKAWDLLLTNVTPAGVRAALNLTPRGAILIAPLSGPLLAIESGTRPADAAWPVAGGAPWRGGRRQAVLGIDAARSRLEAGHAEAVQVHPLLRVPGRKLVRLELYDDYRATNALMVAMGEPFSFVLTDLPVGAHTFALRAVDDAGSAYRSAPFTATVTTGLRLAVRSIEGSPALEFASVSGQKYTLLASHDLLNWEPLAELTASGPATSWLLEDPLAMLPKRFYKVRYTP
jgi:outer membrane protein assembly factor BamB